MIVSLEAPDSEGRAEEITLCHRSLSALREGLPSATTGNDGRVGNRIAGGSFVLDGLEYNIPINNGPNSLHGGDVGFDKRLWLGEEVVAAREHNAAQKVRVLLQVQLCQPRW